jgi:hypothetical protein
MSKKLRNISYATIADCIADVETLRRGYRAGGNWTLPQVCFHLAYPLEQISAARGEPTTEQKQVQGFVDGVLANGWPEAELPASKPMTPPADVGPEAIDRFINAARKFSQLRDDRVEAYLLGPIEVEKLRRFALIHAAHHLNYFAPAT